MASLRPLAAIVALTAGCTIVYDPDGLRHRDAAPDAPAPDAMPVDGDPSMLRLDAVEPAEIDEGTGGAGGRPVVVIVTGANIIAATVDVAFVDGALEAIVPDQVGLAATEDRVAIALRVPVMPDLAAGATRTLRITVSQDGAAPATIDVVVRGLDELVLAGGPVAASDLDPLYARIEITGDVHVTGTAPPRLRATGDVLISGTIDVDATDATGGAGGCNGGAANGPGGCGDGSGEAGANPALLGNGGGGGGGGYGDDGNMGLGTGAGAGGEPTGNDMLVPLGGAGTGAGNRGNGGGGGGNGTLNAGGAGGGGGGAIELVAGGDIVVTGGAIRAAGAPGAGANGGGGGGSGGAILVRAGGAISSTGVWLSAPGGLGADASNDGGAGSVGRIRVDAPAGDVAPMATEPTAIRGPAWDPATPFLVDTREVELTLHGQAGRSLAVLVDDAAIGDVAMGPSGSGTASLTGLELGRNRVCAVYTDGGASPSLEFPEALSCIDLVYLR